MPSYPGRRLGGPATWHGHELTKSDSWLRRFTPSDVDRLRADLDKIRRKEIREITRHDIGLAPLFAEIRHEVLNGRGFVLLRGIDLADLSIEDAARLFWGIGTHFGRPLPQNAKGHLLGHVKDLKLRSDDPAVRIYQTSERQGFHTDSCDIVALMCLSRARSGGLSSLASTWTAFNEMNRRRPDLAMTLFEPIWTDHRGEHPPGANPWFSIPVFSWHLGKLIGMYQRRYIESAQRFPAAPRLSGKQKEALDLLDEVLEEILLQMSFEPGDIQFVHNHQILHDRTAFEDDPQRPRHLLRLWLAPEEGWELPPVFAERFGSVNPGDRGGIRIPGLDPTVSLTP
ncbi:MAG TPA: TauD/TfdA family dioxygenase [Planctomycetota bacterium]|nr:TauD/TfdA family dioxygenase [Planctomycetota bacterium]